MESGSRGLGSAYLRSEPGVDSLRHKTEPTWSEETWSRLIRSADSNIDRLEQ